MGEQGTLTTTRSGLWGVRVLVFVTFFDLFVQYPIAAPYASELGASAALVGLIVAAYSISNLAANVVAGFVLDRWGRFVPILVAVVVTALVVATYAVVASPLQLLVLRILHGLAVAMLAPGAFALAGDLAHPEGRARVMGVNGAVIAVAAIIAPTFAGIMQERAGYDAVFLADAAMLVVSAGILLLLRRSFALVATQRPADPPGSWAWTRSMRHLAGPFATILAFTVALGILVTNLPERLAALGLPASVRGAAFSLYGLIAAAIMVSPLTARFARQRWSAAAFFGLSAIALGLWTAGVGSASPIVVERLTLVGAAHFG
ncbi:MAG: MFS transporter, partial [Thermomicrobium sp.]|nr:MFS transporter [Thermomicrobium sp.]